MFIKQIDGHRHLVVTDKSWYIKIPTFLNDRRHNNEFLIFDGKDIDNHINNLKILWNETSNHLISILNKNKQKILDGFFGREEDFFFDIETPYFGSDEVGFYGSIDTSQITDYDIDFLLKEKFDKNWSWYFFGVINIRYLGLKNSTFEFSGKEDLDQFISDLERYKKIAYLINSFILDLNENHRDILYKEEVNHNNKEYLEKYLSEYQTIGKIIPIKPSTCAPDTRSEHGSSFF